MRVWTRSYMYCGRLEICPVVLEPENEGIRIRKSTSWTLTAPLPGREIKGSVENDPDPATSSASQSTRLTYHIFLCRLRVLRIDFDKGFPPQKFPVIVRGLSVPAPPLPLHISATWPPHSATSSGWRLLRRPLNLDPDLQQGLRSTS